MTKQIVWNVSCFSLAIINIISLIIWFYLKLSGETSNFCIYDSNFFLFHYLLFFLYSLVIIDYPRITVIIQLVIIQFVNPSFFFLLNIKEYSACIFYTRKFIAIGFCLIEFEAIILFMNKYKQIIEYLMIDNDEDRLVIAILHCLFIFGIIRFLLLQFGYYMVNGKLNQQILIKHLNPEKFGSSLIFLSDWTIIQLYIFTNYLYGFQMPMILFTSYIHYVYYKYIRIRMEQNDELF